jgi:hypothetical protein
VLLILDHFLQLPQLKHNVCMPHKNHPQQVLLKCVCHPDNILDETMMDIFILIIHSQLKDTTYLEEVFLDVTVFQDTQVFHLVQ